MALPTRGAPGPAARGAAAPAGPRPAPTGTRPAAGPPRGAAEKPRVDWNDPARKERLRKRGEHFYRTKDGAQRRGLLNMDVVQEKGISRWEFSTGKKYWDIIPYFVGEQDPDVFAKKLVAGEDEAYTVGVYFHKIGYQGREKIICLARTYGLACPICEYREQLARSDNADEDVIRSLYPQQHMMHLYYIFDRDAEGKGVQLAMISGWFFEKALQVQAFSDRGGGYTAFMDPGAGEDGGRHIAFEIKGSKREQDWGRGVKFDVRKEPVPTHILNQALDYGPLDQFLQVPSYEEVNEAFWQGQQPEEPEQQGGEAGQGSQGQEETGGEYSCYASGNYGGYQDCLTTCPYGDPHGECAKAGYAEGYEPPDIPSDPAPPPRPEPEPAKPAAAAPPQGDRSLPPRGQAPGGKPPLLRK